MNGTVTPVIYSTPGSSVKSIDLGDGSGVNPTTLLKLKRAGISLQGLDGVSLETMKKELGRSRYSHAADNAIVDPTLPANINVPVQFLQEWLPEVVEIVTAARQIDQLIGMDLLGEWHYKQVIQTVIEPTGKAQPYSDNADTPIASFNDQFVTRTVRRFEQGMTVARLEAAALAAARIDTSVEKRASVLQMLEIERNRVGFSGFNSGTGGTYGMLNHPNLPAYVAAPTGGWGSASLENIINDIRTGMEGTRISSGERVNPYNDQMVIGVAAAARGAFSQVSTYGYSVNQFIKDTYPNTRVVSVPEFDGANGNQNVVYYFPEYDTSEGVRGKRKVFMQLITSKLFLLGTQQRTKDYIESYSNATAGVLCRLPYAVYRQTGV